MIRCPSCHMDNVEGAAFCDNCGKPLPAAANAVMPPTVAASSVSPANGPTVVCTACGTPAMPGEQYCSNCGAPLPAAGSAGMPPSVSSKQESMATAPVTPPGVGPTMPVEPPVSVPQPYLMVVTNGARLNLGSKKEVLVGRVDPVSGIFPEVDLTPYGGDEGGVSRRHIKISLAGNQYFVEDLNSTNGTWIGQARVQPGARVALNNGDQLRLGKVLLNFFTG